MSHYFPIRAGVLQGSVLALTPFLLHITDLLSVTTNHANLYADTAIASFHSLFY